MGCGIRDFEFEGTCTEQDRIRRDGERWFSSV